MDLSKTVLNIVAFTTIQRLNVMVFILWYSSYRASVTAMKMGCSTAAAASAYSSLYRAGFVHSVSPFRGPVICYQVSPADQSERRGAPL